MHFLIAFALILTYGLMLIFALLHVVQSLIARPTYAAELTTPPVASRPNQLGGNAHARAE
jgi:hypothetical protein